MTVNNCLSKTIFSAIDFMTMNRTYCLSLFPSFLTNSKIGKFLKKITNDFIFYDQLFNILIPLVHYVNGMFLPIEV